MQARTRSGARPGTRSSRSWESDYATRLAITDLVVVAWAVVGAQLTRFPGSGLFGDDALLSGDVTLGYTTLSVLLTGAWMIALSIAGSRDSRVIGTGPVEYRRIVDASLKLFGVLAILAFLLHIDPARSYVLLAFPLGVIALVLSRWIWRQWLRHERARGGYSARVVLVGSRDSVVTIARELGRMPSAGYRVVVACIPGGAPDPSGLEVPVVADLDDIPGVMRERGADTVVVTSSDELPAWRIRRLSWSLEPGRQHLVVVPSLTDIGGPRIHMRPVAGLPLVHVETPRYEGFKRFAKRGFDVIASGLGLLVLAPVLLAIAAAVKAGSPGPVLFRQERVGFRGDRFRMLKFRSMVVDAEARLAELERRDRTEGNTVMFKMRDDPRVTPIGRVLRRYSLDELPQLFNVFAGSMSLVGPRPPLDREVEIYENHVHRRFLVKPGVTGLWQVSGRSNLSWEDTVRLDLYYVENWSLTGDLVILSRTARAVFASEGAY
jgi:exopolysaccharide biosynthesis polyprenyl glycosylphosphotransferase